MQSDTEHAGVVLVVNNVLKMHYKDGFLTNPEKGDLEVLFLQEKDLVMLKFGGLIYALNPGLPIFANTRPDEFTKGKAYLVSGGDSQMAFVFADNVDKDLIADLESILDGRLLKL